MLLMQRNSTYLQYTHMASLLQIIYLPWPMGVGFWAQFFQDHAETSVHPLYSGFRFFVSFVSGWDVLMHQRKWQQRYFLKGSQLSFLLVVSRSKFEPGLETIPSIWSEGKVLFGWLLSMGVPWCLCTPGVRTTCTTLPAFCWDCASGLWRLSVLPFPCSLEGSFGHLNALLLWFLESLWKLRRWKTQQQNKWMPCTKNTLNLCSNCLKTLGRNMENNPKQFSKYCDRTLFCLL